MSAHRTCRTRLGEKYAGDLLKLLPHLAQQPCLPGGLPEQHGYVERRPDPGNRWATLVCFTERGWDEADACARILDHLDEELTSRVGPDKLQQLHALLTEVTDVLHDSTGAHRPRRASSR